MLQQRQREADHDRASDVLAVHSLDHFALSVPDLTKAQEFYELFGLRTAERGAGLELRTLDGLAGYLYEGPRRTLHHLSFGVYEEDLPRFAARLEREKVARIDPLIENGRTSIWCRDADGHAIELAVLPRRSPQEKTRMRVEISPAGVPGAPEFGRKVVPQRLGHCLRFSPDIDRQVDFYTRILGLRLADRSRDVVAFLYSPHGSDHHLLAFARSTKPGFHHASFEVPGVDDIGLGAQHMLEHGFAKGWGFGRHYLGSNYFHYVRDPWGGFAEYFCDIDYIPAGSTWEARDVDPRFALHLWGPVVPPYFLENYEGADPAEV